MDMSLILNSDSTVFPSYIEHADAQEQHDASLLDRYLGIMETNRTSSHFVPNDALLALDMAGFIRSKLAQDDYTPSLSTARLALALVQHQQLAPVQ